MCITSITTIATTIITTIIMFITTITTSIAIIIIITISSSITVTTSIVSIRCGSGRDSAILAAAGFSVLALDRICYYYCYYDYL